MRGKKGRIKVKKKRKKDEDRETRALNLAVLKKRD